MKDNPGFFNNKLHFLHKHLSFLEALEYDLKATDIDTSLFSSFLHSSGINVANDHLNEDHSTINWHLVKPRYQFFFDYEGNEEITEWLNNSKLKESEFLYTNISLDDRIIKIKTEDFILSWEWFYIAAVQGIILITEERSCFLEFTDDYKFHLNSNFEIKPGSKVIS